MRARILKAAETVFARQGFSGARLMEIAAEAGLPKANLLYYFRSKEEIYRSVCQDILETWLGALGDISAKDKPEDALRKYIEAKMDLSLKRPNASKVFAMEIIAGAPVIGDYLAHDLKDWVSKQAEVFEIWQARGEMAEVPPRHVLFLIWAATQTYADFSTQITAVLGSETISADEYAKAVETVTEVILRGLGTR
ncbi:TetR family transcriptional regulator C-terminal domain-containing protein [Alphaproteobacteria bacterium LSUCC0684]